MIPSPARDGARTLLCVWAAASLAAVAGARAEGPTSEIPAHPQRPGRVVNTSTTVPGYVTLEGGLSLDNDRLALPQNFRFGISRRWEAFVAFSPLVVADSEGDTEYGHGDIAVGAKVRVFESDEGEAAFDGFYKFGAADEEKGLGSGKDDAGFRFIASRTWGKNSIDFNLGAELAGVREASSGDAQWTTVLCWTRAGTDRLHYFGELFVQFLPASDFETVTTDWGLQYYINPSFVFDTAVYFGLSDDAPSWQLQVGFTKVLGRIGGRKTRAKQASLFRSPAPAP